MKVLLVVDLQKQFRDRSGKYEQCLEYIRTHREEYDKVVATLFRQDRSLNGNYAKLRWSGCMDADISDLEFKADQVVIKYGYGLPQGFFGNDKVTVIGCDADACVLATCFSLWDDGIDFRFMKRYIYTTGNIPMDAVWKIYDRNFGDKRKAKEYVLTKRQIRKK